MSHRGGSPFPLAATCAKVSACAGDGTGGSDDRDLAAERIRCGLALDWAKFSGGTYRHRETPEARRQLWCAEARQRGRMRPQREG